MRQQRSLPFPPADWGVVGPLHDRQGFLLGLTMFTASRPVVVRAQQLSFWVARAFGPRVLPGRRTDLVLGEWEDLVAATDGLLADVVSVATYLRRDPRAGTTMLVRRTSGPPVLLKSRDDGTSLQREQSMLRYLQDHPLPGIAVPPPLGSGVTAAGRSWSAQAFVFRRPHRPVLALDQPQLDALAKALAGASSELGLDGRAEGGAHSTSFDVPAHRDLTPWNLRRDHEGRIWLLDWEEVGLAPPGADGAYLSLTAGALLGTPPERMRPDLAEYWLAVLERRLGEGHTQPINRLMVDYLHALAQPG